MRWSDEQYQAMMQRGRCKVLYDSGEIKKKEKGGLRSKKIEVDGYFFDSKKEALIYHEFKLDPDVEILELQPLFEIQPGFSLRDKKYQPIRYTADFKILKKNSVCYIVEVKSIGTLKANSKSYPMRRKMLLNSIGFGFREIIFDGKRRIIKEY